MTKELNGFKKAFETAQELSPEWDNPECKLKVWYDLKNDEIVSEKVLYHPTAWDQYPIQTVDENDENLVYLTEIHHPVSVDELEKLLDEKIKTETVVCPHCGKRVKREDAEAVMNHDHGREYVCRECRMNDYVWCQFTEEYWPDDMVKAVRGMWMSEDGVRIYNEDYLEDGEEPITEEEWEEADA